MVEERGSSAQISTLLEWADRHDLSEQDMIIAAINYRLRKLTRRLPHPRKAVKDLTRQINKAQDRLQSQAEQGETEEARITQRQVWNLVSRRNRAQEDVDSTLAERDDLKKAQSRLSELNFHDLSRYEVGVLFDYLRNGNPRGLKAVRERYDSDEDREAAALARLKGRLSGGPLWREDG